MKAIVTVVGHDKTGIIKAVSGTLADGGANIMDISQTLMQDYFVMIALVDLTNCRLKIDELRQRFDGVAKELGVDIRIQHEDVFNCMHRI